MTGFCLVRHGAYPLLDVALGGRADHGLNAAGREQAARAAERLAGREFAAVLSSPVVRARETAAPIAAALSLVVSVEPRISEIDYGAWTGAHFASLTGNPGWRDWNEFRGTAAVPGGETMLAVQTRAVAALLDAATRWPEGEVVMVSHADVIRAVVAHCLGVPLDLLLRIDIDAGSITELNLHGSRWKLRYLNHSS